MARCANYLSSLGQQECRIPSGGAQMCRDGSAIVYGNSVSGERATPWYVFSCLVWTFFFPGFL